MHSEPVSFLYAQLKQQPVPAEGKRTASVAEWAQAPIPGPIGRGNGQGSTSQRKTHALSHGLLWPLGLLRPHFLTPNPTSHPQCSSRPGL